MSSDLTSFYSHRNINAINSNDGEVYEFERFRLETANRMLFEKGQPVRLAPKVIETLIALVRSRGEIISKENLMNEVWANSFVEESNLTQHIYLLRKTLGKSADGRDLIETFRRRGYLFTGQIKQAESFTDLLYESNANGRKEAKTISTNGFQVNGETPAPPAGNTKKYFISAVIAATAILLLAVFAAPHFFDSKSRDAQNQTIAAPNLKNTRVTPDRNILSAAFTPDGKYLIYTIQEKGKHSVWLKDLATDSETQIRPAIKEPYLHIIASRDKFLYYVTARENSPNGTIVRTPIGGGSEQTLARDVTSPFTLSPDEKQLAYTDGKFRLMVGETNENGGEPRILATRDKVNKWYESWSSRLSWSPDGASIVICGGKKDEKGKVVRELIEVSVADGAEKIIPTPENWEYVDDAVWLGDKSAVMVTARETAAAPFQIWRVAYPNGETRRVTSDSNAYADLNVSPDSRLLVVIKNFGNLNLWTAPFKEISKIRQITSGSAALDGVSGIAFAPDGKIIYTSPRGENVDLWQTEIGGSNEQKQLTKNAGDWNGRPQATADGRYIVFTSTRSGTRQIWRMDADGGNPKQLINEPFADEPRLTANGEQIYYTVIADEKNYISKISIDGGESARVSLPATQNFFNPVVSPDGRYIFCALHDLSSNAPWKSSVINAETGEIVEIFDFTFGTALWNADSKSIFYSFGTENLWQISIDGENVKPQQTTDFESGTIRTSAVSPDYKQIAFSRGNSTNEAVLLENF